MLHKGEVDIKMEGKKISEIGFESFFPKEYDESYCRYYTNGSPLDFKEKLESWVEAENPLRLIIDELAINELVNISKFIPEIRAGEIGDIYYSIEFRTHNEPKITTIGDSDDSYQGGLVDYNNRSFANDNYSEGDTVRVVIKASVYNGPGSDFDIIGTLDINEQYKVYADWNGWLDIQDYGLYGGYVYKGFVTKA